MVDAFSVVAFAELFTHKPTHHDLHPLFSDNGILSLFERLGVVVVNAVEGGRNGRLLGQESRRFRGRHGEFSACRDSQEPLLGLSEVN